MLIMVFLLIDNGLNRCSIGGTHKSSSRHGWPKISVLKPMVSGISHFKNLPRMRNPQRDEKPRSPGFRLFGIDLWGRCWYKPQFEVQKRSESRPLKLWNHFFYEIPQFFFWLTIIKYKISYLIMYIRLKYGNSVTWKYSWNVGPFGDDSPYINHHASDVTVRSL